MTTLIVIPDNGSRHHWPPMGAGYLASSLQHCGERTCVWHQDISHEEPSAMSHYVRFFNVDTVAVGWIAGKETHRQAMTLCEVAKTTGKRLVVGGHGPSSDPVWHLTNTGADVVLVGESEKAAEDWNGLDGIVVGDEPEEYQRCSGWDSVPLKFDKYLPMPAARSRSTDLVAPVLTGRGCPYRCSFCYRQTDGRWDRPIESIIGEVEHFKDCYGVTFVQFQDELLMTSPKRVEALCDALQPLGIRWSCQGRVNVAARDLGMLQRMHDAGCRFINYGVESTSQRVLDLMKKKQTPAQAELAVSATKQAGISPGLNMLWGAPGDNLDSLNSNVEFLLRHDDGAQLRTIRPVTPYPGSPLYQGLVADGVIEDTGDFYEQLVNSDLVCWDMMKCGDLAWANTRLMEANLRLLDNWRKRLGREHRRQATALYLDGDETFRGWRQT